MSRRRRRRRRRLVLSLKRLNLRLQLLQELVLLLDLMATFFFTRLVLSLGILELCLEGLQLVLTGGGAFLGVGEAFVEFGGAFCCLGFVGFEHLDTKATGGDLGFEGGFVLSTLGKFRLQRGELLAARLELILFSLSFSFAGVNVLAKDGQLPFILFDGGFKVKELFMFMVIVVSNREGDQVGFLLSTSIGKGSGRFI